MSLNLDQFRDLIERTLLRECPAWLSGSAVELLLGTCAVESDFGEFRRQVGGGPARGIFQMEPETFYWIRNYCRKDAPILDGRDVVDIETDDELAIVAARARYRVAPVRLPTAGNTEAQALYWKFVYNTISGKGRVQKYLEKYNHYVIGG